MGTRAPRGARGGCPCAASCSQGGLEKEEAERGTKPTLLSPPAQRLGQAGQAEQVERASGGCRGDHHEAPSARAGVPGAARPVWWGAGLRGGALLLSSVAPRPCAVNGLPCAVHPILMKPPLLLNKACVP